jgi:hypothetical protein
VTSCQHSLNALTCLIGGTCYANGANNPANECEHCDTAVSTGVWTPKAYNAACTADAISCTLDICNGASACTHPVDTGFCLIGGVCVSSGVNPSNECQTCSPTTSQSAWTNKANGVACGDDGFTCTSDVCSAGSCSHPINSGNCLIDDGSGPGCYVTGDGNLGGCGYCSPGWNQTVWRPRASSVVCGTCDVCTPNCHLVNIRCDGFTLDCAACN